MIYLRLSRRYVYVKPGLVLYILLIAPILWYYHFIFKPDLLIHTPDTSNCPLCFGMTACSIFDHKLIKPILHGATVRYGSFDRYALGILDDHTVMVKHVSVPPRHFHMHRNGVMSIEEIKSEIEHTVNYTERTDGEQQWYNGIFVCPHTSSVINFKERMIHENASTEKSTLLNLWTILNFSPDVLMASMLAGESVPRYHGSCGQVQLWALDGQPLISIVTGLPWYRKLSIVKKIINFALNLTFKNNRYRFYLRDWTLHTILVNDMDDVIFTDLNNVIVYDKIDAALTNAYDVDDHVTAGNMTYGVMPNSVVKICDSYTSDYNLWSACDMVIGSSLAHLYAMPTLSKIKKWRRGYENSLRRCWYAHIHTPVLNRIHSIRKLLDIIDKLLQYAPREI